MEYKQTYSGQRQQHSFNARSGKKRLDRDQKEQYESTYSPVHKQRGRAEHQAAAKRNMVNHFPEKNLADVNKKRILANKNALSQGQLYDEHTKELSPSDTAVTSGDMYTDKAQPREVVMNSVTKTNGLRNANFKRRTAPLYTQGVERIAFKRRRTNYRGKTLDEQLGKQIWRLMRSTMHYRNEQKRYSLYDLLGCELKALKLHLSGHFEEGMDWSNYGDWVVVQIQHKPANEGEIDERYWHYSNMKPAWR